uniref:Uncharacterized protein n=1 Tax=Anguilla anguilla TaxID=7936 RepID=A0A0E9XMT4_ANGAN
MFDFSVVGSCYQLVFDKTLKEKKLHKVSLKHRGFPKMKALVYKKRNHD